MRHALRGLCETVVLSEISPCCNVEPPPDPIYESADMQKVKVLAGDLMGIKVPGTQYS